MTLKHAIVGCGRVAAAHADAFGHLLGTRTMYAVDSNLDRAVALATRFGFEHVTDAYEEVLRSNEVGSISLAVPHDLHASMAIQAIEAGKHVLVEKPFVLTLAEGRRVIEAAATHGVVVLPVSQHRFDSVVVLVRELIDSGALGTIAVVRGHLECVRETSYYTESAWRGSLRREGGSVLINQAYHIVDLLLWLVGDVQRVSAEIRTLALHGIIETEDTVSASLAFSNGAVGVLSITGAAGQRWGSYIEVAGTGGVIAFDISTPNRVHRLEVHDARTQARYEERLGAIMAGEHKPSASAHYHGNAHRDQARAFLEQISGHIVQEAATPTQALRVVETINCVYRSARGHSIVDCVGAQEGLVEHAIAVDLSKSTAVRSTSLARPTDERAAEIAAVIELLQQGTTSVTSGGILAEFEQEFSAFAGCSQCVAFCNGTGAIHAALFAVGVGPGDDVLVCDYSFHGTVAAILRLGARVVPVDCLGDSLTMDPDDLRRARTPASKAVVVHNPWGVPAEYSALREAAGSLAIISDASHAHGAQYERRPIAAHADITCFSLGPGKLISGGELGAAVTDNPLYRDRMLIYGHVNRVPRDLLVSKWKGNAVGLKLRPHAVALAIGLTQLRSYNYRRGVMERRCRELEARIAELGLLPQSAPHGSRRVYWKLVSRLDGRQFNCTGAEVEENLRQAGVPAEGNEYWPLIQKHALFSWPGYRRLLVPRSCPTAHMVSPSTVRIRVPDGLTAPAVTELTSTIRQALNPLRIES